jgi:hypothetical protein
MCHGVLYLLGSLCKRALKFAMRILKDEISLLNNHRWHRSLWPKMLIDELLCVHPLGLHDETTAEMRMATRAAVASKARS